MSLSKEVQLETARFALKVVKKIIAAREKKENEQRELSTIPVEKAVDNTPGSGADTGTDSD